MTCPNHDARACCTACTSSTDGYGFPHPSVAGNRVRLQQCLSCARWVAPWEWVSDGENAVFCCRPCAPHQYEMAARSLDGFAASATNPLRKRRLESRAEKARAAARKLVIAS